MVVLKTISHTDTCRLCELKVRFDELSFEQREAICQLVKSGQSLEAIREVSRLLNISIGDAAFVANKLAK